jgi:DNA repair protein RadA
MTEKLIVDKKSIYLPELEQHEYLVSIKSKLVNAGYLSPRLLALSTSSDIAEKLQVNLSDAEKIIAWASQKLESGTIPGSFRSAEDLYNTKKEQQKLSTGCKVLDSILGGGIEPGVLTEFYGSAGVGKTQLCYTLSVMVQQLQEVGGLEGRVIYIDTENKFSPDRIIEIAKARRFDTEHTHKNIYMSIPINSIHQERDIVNIAGIAEKDRKIKLVIFDSIINLYRREFTGRQNLSERQNKLEKCVRTLTRIARLYDVAVVITNQLSSLPDSYSIEPYVAAGGNVLAHASKHRISLKKIF